MADTEPHRGPQPRRAISASQPPPPESAVYFLSLAISEVKCFGPLQTLDLSTAGGRPAQWTIILGDNGTGKTTLLQALAGMEPEQSHWGLFPRLPSHLLYNWAQYEADTRPSMMRATVGYGTSLRMGLEPLEKDTIQVEMGEDSFDDNTSGWGAFWSHITDPRARELICYGYGATRRMGSVTLQDEPSADSSASLFSEDIPLLNAEEWLLQADYAALSTESARKRRDEIVGMLTDLLPDVHDIRFVRPSGREWTPRVEVGTPYGWVKIRDLSLGYRTLVAWLVDLAYRLYDRYPDSPNPLAEPAVVLVDEIDLHLHPKWQRSLISYLTERFPNTQFIVTAHSPLIVQAATDANIVLLRREGDHVVIDNAVEAIHGWRIDQVLTSDLFGLKTARPPEFDELLAQRNQILGKAELTRADQRELKRLDAEIGTLPTGETPEDIEAMDIIRQAAEVLKKGAGGA